MTFFKIPRPSISVVASIAVLLLVGMLFGPALAGPEAIGVVADVDGAVDTDQEVKSCGTTMTVESILASPAYLDIHSSLQEEPGFVDLYVGHDGIAFAAVAVFDMDERTTPPPEVPVALKGIPVQVAGHSFAILPDTTQGEGLEAAPLIPTTCPSQIRPGARMTSPAGCTFSFVYTDQNGRWYIATAGHCTTQVGQRVSAAGITGAFGTTVFTTGSGGVGNDFALILIDTDKEGLVNPAMCHWGGPTGTASSGSLKADHYGWGIGYSILPQTRARSGFLTFTGTQSWTFTGTAIFGDSGSGVINSNGPALGTLTHIGVGFVGNTFGTRATHGINLAEGDTGDQYTLQTAPLS